MDTLLNRRPAGGSTKRERQILCLGIGAPRKHGAFGRLRRSTIHTLRKCSVDGRSGYGNQRPSTPPLTTKSTPGSSSSFSLELLFRRIFARPSSVKVACTSSRSSSSNDVGYVSKRGCQYVTNSYGDKCHKDLWFGLCPYSIATSRKVILRLRDRHKLGFRELEMLLNPVLWPS